MASSLSSLPPQVLTSNKSPSIVNTTAVAGTGLPIAGFSSALEVCSEHESSSPSMTSAPSSSSSASALTGALQAELEPLGFECHPLLIGWYNVEVASGFRLPQSANTVAVIVLSTPDMFEHCFVPHLCNNGGKPSSSRDLLDSCMRRVIGDAARRVHGPAQVLYDFELGPTRRPRVLVQTAGHVSGAVRLYRRQELCEDPWPDRRAVMGVCLHPQFGGWFALRALVVLEGVEAADLPRPEPPEILTSEDQKREVIELFNFHWRDWRYRDVGGVRRLYSALQKEYFSTPPGERQAIVERIIRDGAPAVEGVEGPAVEEVRDGEDGGPVEEKV